MPYHFMKQGDQTCIAKDGEDRPIPGGCHATEAEAQAHMAALHANVPEAKMSIDTNDSAQIYSYTVNLGVKAVGDWELDVRAIPFGGTDSDGQYFDAHTDLMLDNFPTPVPVYYHSIKEGTRNFDARPEVLGKTVRTEVRPDGVWARVILNKASERAQRVWEAAKQGLAVASSGTIKHLARLEVGGRLVPYDKGTPGRIAVWPFGELSLWDSGPGMASQAHPYAVATPAIKAVYQQAGIILPDINLETEAQEADATGDVSQSAAAKSESGEDKPKHKRGKSKMAENETPTVDVEALVNDKVNAALKAANDKAEAERKAKEEEDKRVADAVEAAKAEWEKTAAAGRRLPFGENDAPIVGKFGATRKFDHLSAADTAFAIETLKAGGAKRSEAIYQALAGKLSSDKSEYAETARHAMKTAGLPFEGEAVKANEVNYSTLASYGDEWVVTANSSALWEQVRFETGVVNKLPSIEVPQGAESIKIPLEGTDPVFYKVAQVTGDEDTGGLSRPLPTAPSSLLGTANNTLSVGQMGARVRYSGALEEDSIVPFAPQLRAQLVTVGAEYLDHVVIDGDTATTASTNINDIAGTPAGTEAYLLFNGFRKIALGTSGRNRSGGNLDEDDFLATTALLGTSGVGADPRKTMFIVDPHTHRSMLKNITALKTADVYPGAPTIQSGMITNIWGYPVMQSFAMGYIYKYSATSITGYENKFNTAGKIDLDTATNNTTGSVLLVRFDRWYFGWKRRMTMEAVRHPEWDGTEITSWLRFGLLNRDTVNAAAITYNVTLSA